MGFINHKSREHCATRYYDLTCRLKGPPAVLPLVHMLQHRTTVAVEAKCAVQNFVRWRRHPQSP